MILTFLKLGEPIWRVADSWKLLLRVMAYATEVTTEATRSYTSNNFYHSLTQTVNYSTQETELPDLTLLKKTSTLVHDFEVRG